MFGYAGFDGLRASDTSDVCDSCSFGDEVDFFVGFYESHSHGGFADIDKGDVGKIFFETVVFF